MPKGLAPEKVSGTRYAKGSGTGEGVSPAVPKGLAPAKVSHPARPRGLEPAMEWLRLRCLSRYAIGSGTG
jgi:hypothetical protein